MIATHYHPCDLDPCGLDGASDAIEFSVWVTAPGGVNVIYRQDGGDDDWAQGLVGEYAERGIAAVVMVRDAIRTHWRKPRPGELGEEEGSTT